MQNVSADYERVIRSQEHGFKQKVEVQGAGSFSDSEVFLVDTSIRLFEGAPQVGTAVSGEANVNLLNRDATIPQMGEIRPYVRAFGLAEKSSTVTITNENLASNHATYSNENITFDADSGVSVSGENIIFAVDSTEYVESEWIPQGVYYIDTRDVTQNQDGLDMLVLHGFDAMLKAEQDYANNEAIGDDYDTAYVSAIASQMGVQVDPRTWDIMQGGHIITFPLGYSCREILGYIAGIYIGSFVMTDEGKLRLVSLLSLPPETNLLVDDIGDVLVFGNDAILI